ncbi:hypothetical protein Vadar_000960 [Vaccinium darrowii]|uniref:Uncharacterized protein n=1 Tax=Vaccinium darrowii TaxID=229202 RepID=A0ACB7YSE4_9ERIC|nr:hypothetical protein Vadar_000960 [Vaccinium darrowii]
MTTSRNTATKNQKIVIIPVDDILGLKSHKCGVNKSPKVINVSAGDGKLFVADNQIVKGCCKRGLTGVGDGPNEKRQKMVPSAMKQCSSIKEEFVMTVPSRKCLEALMSAEEKEKLKKMLSEVSRGNVPLWLQSLLKQIGVNRFQGGGNIELDMDAFGEDILLKLRRIARLVGERAGKKRDQEREAELKKQRERERKAARLALEEVEKTVEIDDNFKTMKDFQMLIQSPLPHQHHDYKREILKSSHQYKSMSDLGFRLGDVKFF